MSKIYTRSMLKTAITVSFCAYPFLRYQNLLPYSTMKTDESVFSGEAVRLYIECLA